ncbi:hypothetical protein PybrP1_012106 [[Pythium] brassicae (nom. inval.)]|nr:hypothetical protein PybrP1_012106 [[Pythium] brassicae (nom. inval.)]
MPLRALSPELVAEVARQHPALQSLNLSHNALRDVAQLAHLPHLRRLDLSANRLRAVPPLPTLEFLDLRANAVCGNPIARQPTYRREVLSALPQLQRLDDADVTPAERLAVQLQLPETDEDDDDDDDDDDEKEEELQDVTPQSDSKAPVDARAATADAAVSPIPSPAPRLLTPLAVHRLLQPQPAASSHHLFPAAASRAARDDARPTTTFRPVPVRHRSASTQSEFIRPVTVSRGVQSPTPNDDQGPPSQAQSHLLQSRVAALESILAIQDKTIQQGLAQLSRTQAASNSAGEAGDTAAGAAESAAQVYAQLLTTWRAKVMSLLVQLQSAELTRSDDARSCRRAAEALETATARAERERELWQQKCADAVAQRDLERVRVLEAQAQSAAADNKVVSAVRTLSAERERLQDVASAVAFFSARDGVMVDRMESLYAVARRLEAFEKRLQFLGERVQTASRLLAHREARLRNSEAAIDAERRIWSHRLAQARRTKHALGGDALPSHGFELSAPAKNGGSGVRKFLRSATEAALRALFHRLDPYGTGLVKARAFLDALRGDVGALGAVGSDAKLAQLVAHIDAAVRLRSMYGTVAGSLTWGELLLLFMPESSGGNGDDDNEAEGNNTDTLTLVHSPAGRLPPPFQCDVATEPVAAPSAAASGPHRLGRKALSAMSRDELVQRVLYLQDDCRQLQRRVLDDARELQRRVAGVRSEWKDKTEQLVAKSEDLQRELRNAREAAKRLGKELEAAERGRGEATHQLDSLRRELLVQQSDFSRAKEAMETRQSESLRREQELWQKELQDVNFSYAVLKAESHKHELRARQLERELSKRNDALVASETQRVAHLEDKLHKRDAELAKLRRERNTILSTLREHERKLATQRARASLQRQRATVA